jgi:hypothetical protein
VRLWLEDCDQNHPECHESSKMRLPTWLLDVGGRSDSRLRVVETKALLGTVSKYTALSYSWGEAAKISSMETNPGNYAEFVQAIDIRNLPVTFRNTIECTRTLHIQYLWIDVFRNIQGKDGHFHSGRGAKHMEDVFGGAYCVLAAGRAERQTAGFIRPRAKPDYVQFSRNGDERFYVGEFVDDYDTDILVRRLHQYRWNLQERGLARRTIYFGEQHHYVE